MGAVEVSLHRLRGPGGAARLAAAALCLWVAAAHVHGGRAHTRIKVLREPGEPARTLTLPLPQAASIPSDVLVFVYRARNTGASPLTIRARVGSHVAGEASIPPGASRRVDLAWARPPRVESGYAVSLEGTHDWVLEYAELANVHGFTRGAIEFLVLPAKQSLDGAPSWIFAAWLAAAVALLSTARVPPIAAAAHLTLSAVVLLFLAAVALAPLVSPFRLAVAPHTFAGALAIFVAPSIATVVMAAWRRLQVDRAIRKVLSAALEQGRRARQATVRAVVAAAALPWLRLACAIGFLAYAAVLATRVGAYAGGADQSGYLNSARLLAEGRMQAPARVAESLPPGSITDRVYAPLGFRPVDGGVLAPTYPVGLPLITAGVARIGGWDAASHVTMVLHALAGVLLIVGLARECGLSPHLSALAALLLATSPLYLFMSLTFMSDVPAMVWVTGAILAAWRSRSTAAWSIAAGAAASIAVLIRPTNVLLFAPLAVCLGVSPRRWLLLALGGLPGALFFVSYNTAAYGSPLASGYGVDFGELFAWPNVWPSLRSYAAWLPVLLTPIGLLAAGLPALRRRAPRMVAVLAVWIAVFLAAYAFYMFTRQAWWFLRFVLPAFPPLIVAAVWVGRDVVAPRLAALPRSSPGLRALRDSGAAAITAGILAHNGWWVQQLVVLESGHGERKYYEVAEWTRAHLPRESVVMAMQASGALFYYTDFPIVRWDFVEPDALHRLQTAAVNGRAPLYAVLFPNDLALNAFRDRLHGRWTQVGAIDDVTIWRFAGAPDGVMLASEAQ